ncbi:LysR family transcriptional regulator [Rhodophyticola sp. CCM32]|uniref:LysR substrate-binding domain-containing protein n=1 Tax=Rhodophyticola sp. CCM32 TaxID=2916397 RepID=UPI00107F537D|nr:LysR substrate-binding domain-containing protein [Rhodophyticola sp. CCM32]QBY00771.1 LysR family transcriptional regulator [Rhodophyticola sp. CCM32]
MRELNRVHLSGLRAVEAVGRLQGLQPAAAELGVSVGAVSQQVKKTESALGRTLFHRTPAGMQPTAAGAEVLTHLNRGMAELATAIRLAGRGQEDRLVVSVAPIFASRWLVWRLSDFHCRYPDIRIRVEPDVALVNPDEKDVDVCIRVGRGGWPGVGAEKLLDQRIFPVCSAGIATCLTDISDLAHVPVIRENEALYGWDVWLGAQGLSADILGEGPTYADASICLNAAIAGQGVFLAWETLACPALDLGQLVAPFPQRFPSGVHYWLITRQSGLRARAIAQFSAWLKEEMEASVRQWRSCDVMQKPQQE